jgi:cellulose synthase/poly-beta-1,6-N-acetylglucosamine synthase-like glycosyltransferase
MFYMLALRWLVTFVMLFTAVCEPVLMVVFLIVDDYKPHQLYWDGPIVTGFNISCWCVAIQVMVAIGSAFAYEKGPCRKVGRLMSMGLFFIVVLPFYVIFQAFLMFVSIFRLRCLRRASWVVTARDGRNRAADCSSLVDWEGHDVEAGPLGKLDVSASGLARTTMSAEQEPDPEAAPRDSVANSPPWRIRWAFLVLALSCVVAHVYFIGWILTYGINPDFHAISSICFVTADVIGLLVGTLFLVPGVLAARPMSPSTWRRGPLTRRLVTRNPKLACTVCRYKEPIEDLEQTLKAALRIQCRGQLDVYVLDDGYFLMTEAERLSYCHRIQAVAGVHLAGPAWEHTDHLYRDDCATELFHWTVRPASASEAGLHVVARKKPIHDHYKAANLNNLLYNYLSHTCGANGSMQAQPPDFILFLDIDMVPSPHVFECVLPYFFSADDEAEPRPALDDLAFVQFPQRFHNLGQSRDFTNAGNEFMFDGKLINLGSVGLVPFCGTNAVWRTDVLYAIGGLQYGSLTEDANTSYVAHTAGWRSAYCATTLAIGEAPDQIQSAMGQRGRWAQGAVEMLLQRVFPRRNHELTPSRFVKPIESFGGALQFTSLAPRLGVWREFFVHFLYFDSLIYPISSLGALLYVATAILYLLRDEAPVKPKDLPTFMLLWLPLFLARTVCAISAYPFVSMFSIWRAQQAWFGYSLCILKAAYDACKEYVFPCLRKGWFNTGARGRKFPWQQCYLIVLAFAILAAIVYRLVAVVLYLKWALTGAGHGTAHEQHHRAWNALCSCSIAIGLLCHLKDWVLQAVFSLSGVSVQDVAGPKSPLRDFEELSRATEEHYREGRRRYKSRIMQLAVAVLVGALMCFAWIALWKMRARGHSFCTFYWCD